MLSLEGASQLTVTEYCQKVLKPVALDQLTARTFDHLKTFTMLGNLPTADTIQVFESKLACAAFISDADSWIEYHGFLKSAAMHLEAKRVIERALAAVTGDGKALIVKQCCS